MTGPNTISQLYPAIQEKKIKAMPPLALSPPPLHPNTFGSTAGLAPIYCATKEQWNFLATAVSFQEDLEPILKDLCIKKDCKKNLQFAEGIAHTISPVLNWLESNASSQAE